MLLMVGRVNFNFINNVQKYKTTSLLNDHVIRLLQTPFGRWKNIDKKESLKQGKPTPPLSCQSIDKRDGKVFSRLFNSNWYRYIFGFVDATINKRCIIGLVCY